MRNKPASASAAADDGVIRLPYQGTTLRVLMLMGQPWFVVADIAAVIGSDDLVSKTLLLPPEERGGTLRRRAGMAPGTVIVSQAGLLTLLGWTYATDVIERHCKTLRCCIADLCAQAIAVEREVQP